MDLMKTKNSSTILPEVDPSWIPIAELPATPTAQRSNTTHDTSVTVVTPNKLSDTDPIDVDDFEESPDTHHDDEFDSAPTDPPTLVNQRPERTRRPNKRVFGDKWANCTIQLTPTSRTMLGHIVPDLNHDNLFLRSLDCWDSPFTHENESFHRLYLLHTDPLSNEVDWMHPFTLAAKASSADAPSVREIQRLSPAEIELWYEAMDIELQTLCNKETMIEINQSDVRHGKQIVRSTWAFKRKRRPNREIHKLKARFVVQGDLQVLGDDEGTFSPVVDWLESVRLLFILTAAQGLKSTTIDFNSAFVQSDLPEPIYLELPPGYGIPNEDTVYKVGKSLYGDI